MNSKKLSLRRALISCSDKTGLVPLCRALAAQGVTFYSTGGTSKFLQNEGFSVVGVETVTGFPEILDGRVKTLHPKIFGGLLAKLDNTDHRSELTEHQIEPFDLVVVNLYPFRDHLNSDLETQVEHLDIGGPSMLRAAAKNHARICVLSDPSEYGPFLEAWQKNGFALEESYRFGCAVRSFERTCAYDAAIVSAWSKNALPPAVDLSPRLSLRYGENPHQKAVWASSTPAQWTCLQGKELSYNNLLDSDAAHRLICDFSEPAVVVIKHATPCGVAVGRTGNAAVLQRALDGDRVSAFGGIVACNFPVAQDFALLASSIFLEVILAPSFDEEARRTLSAKKNLRLIEIPPHALNKIEVRAALGGWLVQTQDEASTLDDLKVVTKTPWPADVSRSAALAWTTVCHARSNAIAIAREEQIVGVGAGQVSRVDAVSHALKKAGDRTQGAVLASDAFFPFRDGIDLLRGSGIIGIIQPGGSMRDGEVIDACDELGIAMAFTGRRGFRH